ncbi:MAG: uncharacterized protein A8A55_2416, partial [Amphiamblys sp. WSBS2006]
MEQSVFEKLFAAISSQTETSEFKELAANKLEEIYRARGCEHLNAFLEKTLPLVVSNSRDSRLAAAELLRKILHPLKTKYAPTNRITIPALDPQETQALSQKETKQEKATHGEDKTSIRERLVRKKRKKDRDRKTEEKKTLADEIKGLFEKENDAVLAALVFFAERVDSAEWTVRHGACLGMLAVVDEIDVEGISRFVHESRVSEIVGVVVRKHLALLVNERFSDFVGSHVDTPVKNACVSSLLSLLQHRMFLPVIPQLVQRFVQMGESPEWQVRHSSVAMISALCKTKHTSWEAVGGFLISLLGDEDGDIREMAASGIAREVGTNKKVPQSQIDEIVSAAVGSLQSTQETENVTEMIFLLSAVLSRQKKTHPAAALSICRYGRYNQTSVRHSVLECLSKTKTEKVLDSVCRTLIGNLALETNRSLLEKTLELWESLFTALPAPDPAHFESILHVLKTPTPFPPSLFEGVAVSLSQESFFTAQDIAQLSEEEATQNRLFLAAALAPYRKKSQNVSSLLSTPLLKICALESQSLPPATLATVLGADEVWQHESEQWRVLVKLFWTAHRIRADIPVRAEEIENTVALSSHKVSWARHCAIDTLARWIDGAATLEKTGTEEERICHTLSHFADQIQKHLSGLPQTEGSIVLSNPGVRTRLEGYGGMDTATVFLLARRVEQNETRALLRLLDGTQPTPKRLLVLCFLRGEAQEKSTRAIESLESACPLERLVAALLLADVATEQPETQWPLVQRISTALAQNETPVGYLETVLVLLSTLRTQFVLFAVVLVFPLLRNLSNRSAAVRKLSSLCFAELVDLVPFDKIKTDTESGTELD